jgi:hypothetical protein
LVECDPSIKAILIKIDTEHNHDFIVEDIDDEHVLVKNMKQDELKRLLKEVRSGLCGNSVLRMLICTGPQGYGQGARRRFRI